MGVLQIKEDIKQLIHCADPAVPVDDETKDLFASPDPIFPREMLYVCMELKKKYPIDYNRVVDRVKTYSIAELAEAIAAQMP